MPIGPCIGCGATNYANSFGGPGICPACDSGSPPTNAPRSISEPFRPIFYPDYSELLQRIREAAGDPGGKLMQDELVERITHLSAAARGFSTGFCQLDNATSSGSDGVSVPDSEPSSGKEPAK